MRQRRRRLLLIAATTSLALGVGRAQPTLRRIGCLFGGSPKTHTRPLAAFRAGLADHGWFEGRNLSIDVLWAEGARDRVPVLAAAIVRSAPDVIVTASNPLIAEVKKATQTIPIVMATGSDPVRAGLVVSLARPGSNITGLSGFYESTPIKMLEVAGALVGRGASVAAVAEADTFFASSRYRDELTTAAATLDLRCEFVVIAGAHDLRSAVETLRLKRPAALIALPGPTMFALGDELVRQLESLSIPAIYPFEEMAEAGGLISFAADLQYSYRRAAYYVDRILRGAHPGELPIEQPTRLALAVNLRSAYARGIRIPPSILHRADRVIE